MSGYRAYMLDTQGHVLSRLEFEAADDAAARTDARQQRSGLSGARAMAAAFPSPSVTSPAPMPRRSDQASTKAACGLRTRGYYSKIIAPVLSDLSTPDGATVPPQRRRFFAVTEHGNATNGLQL